MRQISTTSRIAIASVLLVTCVVVVATWILTSGQQLYSLDDPYIHLQLAKMMGQGTYGFWPGEPAAPSSSVIWPLLLVPLSAFALNIYTPLILNLIFLILTTLLLCDFFEELFPQNIGKRLNKRALLATLVSIVLSNQIGITFTGMEHTLHCLLAIFVFINIFRNFKDRPISPLMPYALIAMPLVRYEGLFLTLLACGFLFIRNKKFLALVVAISTVALLITFSFFLHSQGLGVLPSSILAKSKRAILVTKWISPLDVEPISVPASDLVTRDAPPETPVHPPVALFEKIRASPIIYFLLIALTMLLTLQKRKSANLIPGILLLALVGHYLIGSLGWFQRYEMYLYLISIVGIIAFQLEAPRLKIGLHSSLAVFSCIFGIMIFSFNSVIALIYTPLAARCIYEQQYQMMRFVRDFYKKPVALNDIGIVAYLGNQKILDLYGLASRKTMLYRRNDPTLQWIGPIVDQESVKLVMLYDSWFPTLPRSWKKVATLSLGSSRVAVSSENVAFYVTKDADLAEMRSQLEDFKVGLPGKATLQIH